MILYIISCDIKYIKFADNKIINSKMNNSKSDIDDENLIK